jgi:APA family basic amino acid/polyamine antiporter
MAGIGCLFLFFNLPVDAQMVLPVWGGLGLLLYFLYGYRKSHVARGIVETHEQDAGIPPLPVPPLPGAHTPGGRDA